MYADPAQIRAHELKIRLNDSEAKLLDALVEYTGDRQTSRSHCQRTETRAVLRMDEAWD